MKIVKEHIDEAIKHLKPRSEEEIEAAENEIKTYIADLVTNKEGYSGYDTVDEFATYAGVNANDVDDVKSLMGDLFFLLSFENKECLKKALYDLVKHYKQF